MSLTSRNKDSSYKKMIVCITGMPGAGKSTACEAVQSLGFVRVNMGDVVREETTRRNLPANDVNVGALMLELRKTAGTRAIADLCVSKIRKSDDSRIVIDGVRSMDEVEVFRSEGQVFLLAIHASPARRYGYLRSRGRQDAPLSWSEFCARDMRELSVGIGGSIALADEVVSNSNLTIDELRMQASAIVKRALKEFED
ncbi:MAG: AAA family ATPase [Thaumarchaeota archaeon]|nr:AAA family ATPase [Nitrososphaerota archaeon]